jgi:hypothetical protein
VNLGYLLSTTSTTLDSIRDRKKFDPDFLTLGLFIAIPGPESLHRSQPVTFPFPQKLVKFILGQRYPPAYQTPVHRPMNKVTQDYR